MRHCGAGTGCQHSEYGQDAHDGNRHHQPPRPDVLSCFVCHLTESPREIVVGLGRLSSCPAGAPDLAGRLPLLRSRAGLGYVHLVHSRPTRSLHCRAPPPRPRCTCPRPRPRNCAVPGSPVEEAGLNDRQRHDFGEVFTEHGNATIMSAFCAESGVQLTTTELPSTRAVTPMGAVTLVPRHLRRIAEGDRQDVLQRSPSCTMRIEPLSPSSAARDAKMVNVGHPHVIQHDHAQRHALTLAAFDPGHQGVGRLHRHGHLVVCRPR